MKVKVNGAWVDVPTFVTSQGGGGDWELVNEFTLTPEYIEASAYDSATGQFTATDTLPSWVTTSGVDVTLKVKLNVSESYKKAPYPSSSNSSNVKITRVDDTHFTLSNCTIPSNIAVNTFLLSEKTLFVKVFDNTKVGHFKVEVDNTNINMSTYTPFGIRARTLYAQGGWNCAEYNYLGYNVNRPMHSQLIFEFLADAPNHRIKPLSIKNEGQTRSSATALATITNPKVVIVADWKDILFGTDNEGIVFYHQSGWQYGSHFKVYKYNGKEFEQ